MPRFQPQKIFFFICILIAASCNQKKEDIKKSNTAATVQVTNTSDSIEKRISDLIQKMTLEEKIGQMNQYNGFWDVTGPAPSEEKSKQKYLH